MSISSVLKKRRSELNMTLLEVANIVGVSESAVQRWESGNIKSLRHSRIVKLAEALQIHPAYLMGWDKVTEEAGFCFKSDDKDQRNNAVYYFNPEKDRLSETVEQSYTNKVAKELYTIVMKLNAEGQEKILDYAKDLQDSKKY